MEENYSCRRTFILSVLISLLWALLSYFLAYYWFLDLSLTFNGLIAFLIITGIAIVPGFFNTFLLSSLIFGREQTEDQIVEMKQLFESEPITILVPAYNEQKVIKKTLLSINQVSYDGKINVIIIDNNSTDLTAEICKQFIEDKEESNTNFELIAETKPGKNFALNKALSMVKTKYVITIDSDTVLHPDALTYIVNKISSNDEISAVAGCILVANPKVNLMTRIQDWDYYISINAIKRCQGEYNSTLVAQGAFSIYNTKDIVLLGGWKDTIGEDIVLSWELLEQNKIIAFEPLAISYTEVPESLRVFLIQRARWARGMIEAIKRVKPWKQGNMFSKFISGIDLWIPYIDFSYTFFWIPGLIAAALFHIYIIVGLYSVLVFPLTILTFIILHQRVKYYYNIIGIEKRRNIIGIVIFIMCYQLLMSPVSLWGYVQEVFGLERVWK